MTSWRAAAVLWLVAGLSSALLIPFMTDPLLLALYAIGAVVAIPLGIASLVRRSERLARLGAPVGGVWLVAYAAVALANRSDPVEYLVLPVVAAMAGTAAGWVSYRLARATDAR